LHFGFLGLHFFFSFFIFFFSSSYWIFFGGHISQVYLFFALFIYLFIILFFSVFFSICANVFPFILLSFPWFRKRHWTNNNVQVQASSE
jgi:hypothetical protein